MGNSTCSQGEVVIRCDEPLAGLAFFWSEEITCMTNVSLVTVLVIVGQYVQDSSEYNISLLTNQVAILFTSCKEKRLNHIYVIESNGTGVVIYNLMGVVYIDRCKVSSNELSGEQETMYGGGGIIMETNEANSQSVCTKINSTFSRNTAATYTSGCFSFWPSFNSDEYFGRGRGGGIIYLSGVQRKSSQQHCTAYIVVCILTATEHNLEVIFIWLFLAIPVAILLVYRWC